MGPCRWSRLALTSLVALALLDLGPRRATAAGPGHRHSPERYDTGEPGVPPAPPPNGPSRSHDRRLQGPGQRPEPHHASWVVAAGTDALAWTQPDRRFHTVTVDVWAGLSLFDRTRLTLLGGLTVASVWGAMPAPEGDGHAPLRRASTAGIGPSVALRLEPWRFDRWSAAVDVQGTLLLHPRRFPPGGDRYNLMWRLGASAGARIAPCAWLWLHARWHHTSNGQGLGPQNPSWEGAGAGLSLSVER